MMKREKRHRLAFLGWWRRLHTFVRKAFSQLRDRLPGEASEGEGSSSSIMRSIQARATMHVIGKLKELMPESDIQSEKISQLIGEYEHTLMLVNGPVPSITAMARNVEPDLDLMRLALRLELEQIQIAYEEGRLSRSAARKMRQNVYLMQLDIEDYV